MDNGTEMLGIKVAHTLRRNRKMTITTRATVSSSVNSISSTEARIVVVRSDVIVIVAEGGMMARNSGNKAFTRSTVLMMFAPGWRLMDMTTAGLPLAYPELRISAVPSVTTAMSLRRTGAPLRYATTRGAYC